MYGKVVYKIQWIDKRVTFEYIKDIKTVVVNDKVYKFVEICIWKLLYKLMSSLGVLVTKGRNKTT